VIGGGILAIGEARRRQSLGSIVKGQLACHCHLPFLNACVLASV